MVRRSSSAGAGLQAHSLQAHSLGAALGLLVDRLVGEPPPAVHPVARFGQGMMAVEGRWWRDDRAAGVRYAATGVGVGVAAGVTVRALAPPVVATAVATTVAVGGRALGEAAMTVADALRSGDLDGARAALPALVGRDPEQLDEKEIARAVVESVAENTADAIVAPAVWATLAGPVGVCAHRAANTLDAMVGYRSPRYDRFGWAAARIDDVMAWPGARLTAVLVALVRPGQAMAVWRVVRRHSGAHPSPNAGVSEAAFAAALGLRLGGENRYGDRVELRATLGDGRPPEPSDIERAVRLQRDVTTALAGLLAAPMLARWLGAARWWLVEAGPQGGRRR